MAKGAVVVITVGGDTASGKQQAIPSQEDKIHAYFKRYRRKLLIKEVLK